MTRVGAAIEPMGVPVAGACERAALAEAAGVDSVWVPQVPNQRDTLTVLAGLAGATKAVAVGSAVVPMYTRPPLVMAQTALTLDELTGHRLVLGLGLGNPMVAGWMMGGGTVPPLPSAREYLTVVTSLIRDGEVNFTGQWYRGNATYAGPRRPELPVHLGTFGPRMLELAAELADGVILWLCSADYVRTTVMPSLQAGWARRERPRGDFPVTLMLSVSLTGSAADRANLARMVAGYGRVPAYRAMFEASGFGADVAAGRPGDEMIDALAVMGGERLADRLQDYRDAGVTQFAVGPQTGGEFDPELFTETLRAAAGAEPA